MREKPARLKEVRNLRQAIMYSTETGVKSRTKRRRHKKAALTSVLASAHDVEAAWDEVVGRKQQ